LSRHNHRAAVFVIAGVVDETESERVEEAAPEVEVIVALDDVFSVASP